MKTNELRRNFQDNIVVATGVVSGGTSLSYTFEVEYDWGFNGYLHPRSSSVGIELKSMTLGNVTEIPINSPRGRQLLGLRPNEDDARILAQEDINLAKARISQPGYFRSGLRLTSSSKIRFGIGEG